MTSSVSHKLADKVLEAKSCWRNLRISSPPSTETNRSFYRCHISVRMAALHRANVCNLYVADRFRSLCPDYKPLPCPRHSEYRHLLINVLERRSNRTPTSETSPELIPPPREGFPCKCLLEFSEGVRDIQISVPGSGE